MVNFFFAQTRLSDFTEYRTKEDMQLTELGTIKVRGGALGHRLPRAGPWEGTATLPSARASSARAPPFVHIRITRCGATGPDRRRLRTPDPSPPLSPGRSWSSADARSHGADSEG